MKSSAELELKELAKVLTVLFPKQHERSATWLASLRPVAADSEARDVRISVAPDRHSAPRSAPQYPTPPVRPRKQPTANHIPAQPPRPAKPAPLVPAFARVWKGSASEWGKAQKGIDIPWDEEQKRVDSIIQQSGLIGWQQGFLSELICLTLDLSLTSSRAVEVEVFIPRCRLFSTILAGVGILGQPAKRFFEINRSDVTSQSLREIAEFGAA